MNNKKDTFIEDSKYLEKKYNKYLNELSYLFNQIHNVNFTTSFWKKSFGLGFRRYLHMCYDGYCFNVSDKNDCKNLFLKDSDYVTPIDFEEYRDIFQNTNFGTIQLSSMYNQTFSQDKNFTFTKIEKQNIEKKNSNKKNSFWARIKRIDFHKVLRRFLKFLYRKKLHKVLILDSYFSNKNRNKLYVKSSGEITDYTFKKINQDSNTDIAARIKYFATIIIEDDFDKFFKNCLIFTFPQFFIENFKTNLNYNNILVENLSCNYIISESWISSTYLSFFLSLAKEIKGINHIYNEHNYMEHQFIGNHNFLISDMVDIFYTIGWEANSKYKNIKQGASLFPFTEKSYRFNNDNVILYMSASPSKKIEEFNSAYGENGENGLYYLIFIEIFFKILNQSVFEEISYRGYPSRNDWLEHSKDKYIDFKRIKHIDDFSKSGKHAMLNSKLVIIDYLATSYLESLLMNIPTIIFWNQDTYYLTDDNKDFFDQLVLCGICQTSPEEAAKFVNELVENDSIEKWWYSEKTQNARKAFLDTNIGNPQDAIDFYLSLAKE